MTPIATLKRVRGNMRVVGRLVRMERESYPGRLHPSMWRRGFLSSRVNSYPGVEDPSVPYIDDVRYQFRCSSLNPPWGRILLQDKNVFADALAARGLGACAPEVYGLVTPQGLRARSRSAHERLRDQDTVVLKPTTGYGGRAVRLASPREVESMAAPTGTALLVQERVTQHPALSRINPHSLNTIRVLTVRLPDGPVLAVATHRWGTARSAPVDNVSSGGLASEVNLATGQLSPARRLAHDGRPVEFDDHPDTGARIAGVVVPHWSAVRDLTVRLMDAFPEVDHVGWDLAVSDHGVRVIEGNGTTPEVPGMQIHGSFLQDPRLREYYERKGLLSRPRRNVARVRSHA
jgi:hypothetical protein